MNREESARAVPRAIGPYSPAVEAGEFLFLSGQIPVDPRTGEILRGGIEEQTRRVFENIRSILELHGMTLDQIVKTTLFLKDREDFDAVNKVYGEYFPSDPPARSTVQAAGLPRDAALEIEAIAYKGSLSMEGKGSMV